MEFEQIGVGVKQRKGKKDNVIFNLKCIIFNENLKLKIENYFKGGDTNNGKIIKR